MKPIIGVSPLWNDKKNSLYVPQEYMDGIYDAGGIPIVLPLNTDRKTLDQLMDTVDGILFTGGHDISPALYGEMPLNSSVICFPKRDEAEKLLLQIAMHKNKAVLGICRGLQFINAALGGTLYQDLPVQHPSNTVHAQQPPYTVPVHEVSIVKSSPLYYKLLGVEVLAVNSCHHQAVKTPAPGLQTMAVSEDGLIEAVCMPEREFFWAVQWHPEYSCRTDPSSRKIFEVFVASAKKRF